MVNKKIFYILSRENNVLTKLCNIIVPAIAFGGSKNTLIFNLGDGSWFLISK